VHTLVSTCLFSWSHFKFSTTGLYHILMTDPSMNRSLENEFVSGGQSLMRETLTKDGKLGLRLLEDLTALAAGGSVCAGLELVHCVPNWTFFSGLMIIGS
jgi:hypothetical protein